MLRNSERTVSQYLVHLRTLGTTEVVLALGGAVLAPPEIETPAAITAVAIGVHGISRLIKAEKVWNSMRGLNSDQHTVAMQTPVRQWQQEPATVLEFEAQQHSYDN